MEGVQSGSASASAPSPSPPSDSDKLIDMMTKQMKQMDVLTSQIGLMASRLDPLTDQFKHLTVEVSQVKEAIATHDSRLAAIEGSLHSAAVNSGDGVLSPTAQELNASIKALDQELASNKNEVQRLFSSAAVSPDPWARWSPSGPRASQEQAPSTASRPRPSTITPGAGSSSFKVFVAGFEEDLPQNMLLQCVSALKNLLPESTPMGIPKIGPAASSFALHFGSEADARKFLDVVTSVAAKSPITYPISAAEEEPSVDITFPPATFRQTQPLRTCSLTDVEAHVPEAARESVFPVPGNAEVSNRRVPGHHASDYSH